MYAEQPFQLPQLWPPFIERKRIQRTLAYFESDSLVTEHGERFSVSDWEQFIGLVFSRELLVFTTSLVSFPYFRQLVELGQVCCTKDGHPTSARLKGKNHTTRWIVESSPWGYTHPTLSFLRLMRDFYEHMGIGTIPSPGSVGQATMRRAWKETYGQDWKLHRHQRPPSMCTEELYQHSTGARSDLLEFATVYDRLVEVDQKNAYAYMFREQPTGRAIRFGYGHVEDFKVWVGNVIVTIPEPGLKWGCFPMKDGTGQAFYPTAPGTYDVWMFNEEVDLCIEEGCQVQVKNGWGWYETTTEPQAWVDLVSLLRDTVPDKEIETLVKLCIVAGIGRHGMRPTRYELSSDFHPGDKMAVGDEGSIGVAFDWWVHATRDLNPTELPHWFQHTLMRCRVALYRAAKPYREKELLVATNTDAFYVQPTDDVLQFKEKRDPARTTGEWGRRELHNVTMPANRHLISDEKIVRPGIPKKKKGVPP